MSRSRSQNAARYGALAERVAAERYGLDVDHSAWHDARDDAGDPWDVKAVMLSRPSPRFRLWEDQHRRLREAGGGYVFVGYVPRGRGIVVDDTRTVRARSLRVRFGPAGDHPKGNQAKVRVDRVLL